MSTPKSKFVSEQLFRRLPNELWLLVAEYLTIAEIAALSLTSRRLYEAVGIRVLYTRDAKSRNSSALFWAAERGNLTVAETSLAFYGDANASRATIGSGSDRGWQGVIHVAAQHGHRDIVALLLDHGADMSKPVAVRATCLCHSLMFRYYRTYERHKSTPSHLLAGAIHDFWKTVDLTIPNGGFYVTPLHIAICHGHPETALLLLQRGASILAEYRTAIRWTVLGTFKAQVAALGMIPLAKQRTILHTAARIGGSSSLIHALVDSGCKPNSLDRDGLMPLHHVALSRTNHSVTQGVIRALVDRGANLNGICSDRARHYPRDNSYWMHAYESPIEHCCFRLQNLDAAIAFLNCGADPTIYNIFGHNLLHLLTVEAGRMSLEAWHGSTGHSFRELVSKVLECGVAVDGPTKSARETALILAAAQNTNTWLLRYLIKLGASVHAVDKRGWTALTHAVAHRQPHHVQVLLNAGADPKKKSKNGRRMLDHAVDPSTWEWANFGRKERHKTPESMLRHLQRKCLELLRDYGA